MADDRAPVRTALYYSQDAYQETAPRAAAIRAGEQSGLMGRQVAGKEFLDAYLAHGSWSELVAVLPDVHCRESLRATCERHPSSRQRARRLRFIETNKFLSAFASGSPAEVLHFPCPPEVRFAWIRESLGGLPYALSGVTHTLCSEAAVEALCQMVTGPYELCDRLICTSQAVVDMARAITEAYADYLRERWGGEPAPRIQFELVPLGVDVEQFQPATPAERAAERSRLGIDERELVVLFVGRLSHHAKAHPFPMLQALEEAARRTGRRVRLLIAGWASLPVVLEAFQEGVRRFAPHVQASFLDGNRPEVRFSVWKAADVFTSLADNLQETFGLVIVEAMASGLPVVASDWDGYRDLVVPGESGFLVPTFMVLDATQGLTAQLIAGEVNYDHFLARANQCIVVDVAAATEAYVRLIEDAELRGRMAQAARQRAVKHFAWSRVIHAYEAMWRQQAAELDDLRARRVPARRTGGPSLYPAPELSFAGYPSRWLDNQDLLAATAGAQQQLETMLEMPLTNYEPGQRCVNRLVLNQVLQAASEPKTVQELDIELQRLGVDSKSHYRATIAWLLKYDLLRLVE